MNHMPYRNFEPVSLHSERPDSKSRKCRRVRSENSCASDSRWHVEEGSIIVPFLHIWAIHKVVKVATRLTRTIDRGNPTGEDQNTNNIPKGDHVRAFDVILLDIEWQ